MRDIRSGLEGTLKNGAQIVFDPYLGDVVSLNTSEAWILMGDFQGIDYRVVRCWLSYLRRPPLNMLPQPKLSCIYPSSSLSNRFSYSAMSSENSFQGFIINV